MHDCLSMLGRELIGQPSYLQTKPNEQIRPLIFSDKEKENCICQNDQNLSYWNTYLVMYPHKCTLKNLKVPGKVGECIFDNEKCNCFQGPKVAPGPLLILACFAHLPPLCYIGKILEKISEAPLYQILDPLLTNLPPPPKWRLFWTYLTQCHTK